MNKRTIILALCVAIIAVLISPYFGRPILGASGMSVPPLKTSEHKFPKRENFPLRQPAHSTKDTSTQFPVKKQKPASDRSLSDIEKLLGE